MTEEQAREEFEIAIRSGTAPPDYTVTEYLIGLHYISPNSHWFVWQATNFV